MTGSDDPSSGPAHASLQCELVDPRIYEEVRLRRLGRSYQEIGRQLGVSAERVHADVTQLLERTRRETTEGTDAVRQMELERIDAVLSVVLEQALAGDLKAINPLIKLMERRSKYLGLDAPERQESSGVVTVYLRESQEGEL